MHLTSTHVRTCTTQNTSDVDFLLRSDWILVVVLTQPRLSWYHMLLGRLITYWSTGTMPVFEGLLLHLLKLGAGDKRRPAIASMHELRLIDVDHDVVIVDCRAALTSPPLRQDAIGATYTIFAQLTRFSHLLI